MRTSVLGGLELWFLRGTSVSGYMVPTSTLVVHILGYPQVDVRKFDDKWSGGDSPRHSALLAILLAHDWKWILRALLSCNFRFTCLFSRLKSFSSFTIHIDSHHPSTGRATRQQQDPNHASRSQPQLSQQRTGDPESVWRRSRRCFC